MWVFDWTDFFYVEKFLNDGFSLYNDHGICQRIQVTEIFQDENRWNLWNSINLWRAFHSN